MTIQRELKDYGINIGLKKGLFGIEYEAEFSEELPPNLYVVPGFKATTDGSLRGYGYEFVSTGPQSHREALENTKALFGTQYYQNCFYNSPRASTHIHRNILNMEHEEVLKVLLSYYLVEALVVKLQGVDRDDNYHCLSMHQAEGGFNSLRYFIDKDYHVLRNAINEEKYTALNLCNVPKLGTIEFRMFPSTKELSDVDGWLDMITTLFSSSQGYKTVDELWGAWVADRRGFAEQALGKTYHRAVADFGQVEVDYLLDMNYSQVFAAKKYYDTRDERKKKPVTGYVFHTERDVDLVDNF
jgi:hypothetical protein